MAYGKGSGGFGPNTKVYSFNIKTKDLPAPVFDVSVKEGDKIVKLDTATRVSGDLIGLRHRESKYQNKVIKSVTATLKDGNEVYFVSVPYTYLGRNIMNGLLGLKTFGGVEIGLYRSKPKTEGKPGFDSVAIRQGGELIYGKYEYKDLPAIKKVELNGTLYSDTSVIDTFFQKEIVALNDIVRAKTPVVANDEAAPEADASHSEDDKSDVPF